MLGASRQGPADRGRGCTDPLRRGTRWSEHGRRAQSALPKLTISQPGDVEGAAGRRLIFMRLRPRIAPETSSQLRPTGAYEMASLCLNVMRPPFPVAVEAQTKLPVSGMTCYVKTTTRLMMLRGANITTIADGLPLIWQRRCASEDPRLQHPVNDARSGQCERLWGGRGIIPLRPATIESSHRQLWNHSTFPYVLCHHRGIDCSVGLTLGQVRNP